MTEQEARQRLQQCLLDLLPANGSMVGNGSLLAQWTQAAQAAGLTATAEDFTNLREDLVVRGLVVKGKGRGGSTGRAAAAAAGSDNFALQIEVPTPVDAADAAARPKATPPKTQTLRAADADEPAQVLSYRHNDRRKNNPEVGLVSEASDPQQPKQTWAYNPHLDPVLNFDSARAELEALIDDALASGDAKAAVAALEEIKRRGAPYLQWAGKAERTSFEVDTVSLHVHERIDPMSILSAVRKRLEEGSDTQGKAANKVKAEEPSPLARQASLFEAPFENLPLRSAVDFYRHDKGWANRLIAGDSLLVMNSLLVKEPFTPKKGGWKTSVIGMSRLRRAGRLLSSGNTLGFLRFADDFSHQPVIDIWDDTRQSGFGDAKVYVVQTANKVVERCLLMTTDPGDLVLDPTCGSGTTAFVAEKWGRRWITCDTSRVAVTLAKQRLMYDKPEPSKTKLRITGPFTVEAVPFPIVLSLEAAEGGAAATPSEDQSYQTSIARSGETSRQQQWRDELLKTGIQGAVGQRAQPGAGDQGRRLAHEQCQARRPGAVGEGGEREGRIRQLVLGRGVQASRDSRHSEPTHSQRRLPGATDTGSQSLDNR